MRGNLATPFVVTLAVAAGCTKSADPAPPPITRDPVASTPKPSPSPSPSPSPEPSSSVTYDGYGSCYRLVDGEKKYVPKCPEALLPDPPKDELVYENGGYCKRVPDGRPVKCPPGGATVILPEPSQVPRGDGDDFLQFGSLRCFHGIHVKCPPGVNCNPPGPEPIPCPPALMPKLASGVKPSKTQGSRCWFGSVEVACPKP